MKRSRPIRNARRGEKTPHSRTSERASSSIDLRRIPLVRLLAAIVGGLLVIAFLAPADAKSVFQGEALPQNLCWLLAGVLAALAASSNPMFRIAPSRTDWVLLALGNVWLLLSCIFADRVGNGRAAFNGFWQIASLASCFAIVSALGRDPKFARAIVGLLLACSLAMSIHGIHQVTVSFPRDRAEYLRDPESYLRAHEIDAPAGSMIRQRFEDRLLNSNEPFATFALTNSLASVLGAVLILGAAVLLSIAPRGSQEPSDVGLVAIKPNDDLTGQQLSRPIQLPAASSFLERLLGAGSSATHLPEANWVSVLRIFLLVAVWLAIAACWILTKSRSSYLAVALGGLVWLGVAAWARGGRVLMRSPKLAVGSLIAIVLVGVGCMVASDRLVLREALKSLGYRLEYWQATLSMIADHWLWGVGLGNFQSYYPKYKLATASEIIADPHNWPLDLAANTSLPFAVLVVYWLVRALVFPGRRNLCGAVAREPGITAATFLGAAVAWVGCVVLLELTGTDVDWDAGVYAWSAAALLLLVLAAWIDRGELSEPAVIASILAVVMCMLTSGSWQSSGVGIPLMCLLGIRWSSRCLPTVDELRWHTRSEDQRDLCQPAESGRRLTEDGGRDAVGQSDRFSPLRPASISRFEWTGVVIALMGLVAFIVQAWWPTSNAWTMRQKSQRAIRAEEAFDLLQRSAATDPLDPAPLERVLQLHAARLSSVVSASEFDSQVQLIDQSAAQLLKNDSASHLNWQLAGNSFLEAAGAALRIGEKHGELLKQAANSYTQAAGRFPTSVQLHLQLATIWGILGDWPASKREVELAFELSEITPHTDQKLQNQLIWLPFSPAEIPSGEIVRPVGGPNWARAEPLAKWLRTR